MNLSKAKVADRLVAGALLRLLAPLRFLRDLRAGYRERLDVRHIAFVKFWGVGNAALLLPVLQDLRERYPAARLTAVTLPPNVPLFERVADRVISVRVGNVVQCFLDLCRAILELRRERIDLAFDFEQFARSSQLLLFLAGARQTIAFDTAGQGRAGLAEVRVPYRHTRHVSDCFQDLARAGGVRREKYRPGGLQPLTEAAAEADQWCRRAGVPQGPLVVLHPGSGDNFPGRRWPTRRFGLLGRRLHDEGAVVAVSGTAAEARLVREVIEASDRPLHDWCGRQDLEQLIAHLARASLLVSNDTAPVHLASGLGVPVIGLYGPNTPLLYGPLSPGSAAFYDAPPCSPCITNFNYKTSRCLNPVCIDAIMLDAVTDIARMRLRRRAAERSA